jgi:transcriptional regulator with XRE-family HTH domain
MPKPAARKASTRQTRVGVAFGKVLRQLRLDASMSQEEFAEVSGYHWTYISQLERGVKRPSLDAIFNLAETLRIAPSTLIRKVERSR